MNMISDTLEKPDIDVASLVTIEGKDAYAVFTAKREDGKAHPIDPIIAKVRAVIDGFKPDLSTASSRKRIASMAFSVAKAKTALEEVGVGLAKEQKEIPKRIDATRAHIKVTLDKMRDEVRQPLTDWETREQDRLHAHTMTLHGLQRLALSRDDQDRPLTANELRANLERLEAFDMASIDDVDFKTEYNIVIAGAIPRVQSAIADRQKFEDDQAALAKFREDAAERERKERDDRLRKEGEDKARLDAENDLRVAVLAADVARRKAADEAAAQVLAAQRATEAAEQRARDAEAKAKAELTAKLKADADAQAAREADKEHRRKVNAKALKALVDGGIATDVAKEVLKLIAADKVPNVSINY